jgi:hypothetical protein
MARLETANEKAAMITEGEKIEKLKNDILRDLVRVYQ